MKKRHSLSYHIAEAAALVLFLGLSHSQAQSIQLWLDTAPNDGSLAAWKASAFNQAANGTYVNMQSGANPANVGTLNFDVNDALVYSFGDNGHRLGAIYYVPGETISSLKAKNFQVHQTYTYDGVDYDPYVQYGWDAWLTPSSWVEVDADSNGLADGVAGFFGNSLWGAYGFTADSAAAQAALETDRADVRKYMSGADFYVRMDAPTGGTVQNSIHGTQNVPDGGATGLLLGAICTSLLVVRRRTKEGGGKRKEK